MASRKRVDCRKCKECVSLEALDESHSYLCTYFDCYVIRRSFKTARWLECYGRKYKEEK